MMLKQSKFAHAFLVGERSTFFNSLTMQLFHAGQEEYQLWREYDTPAERGPLPVDMEPFIEAELLVPDDREEDGTLLARLRELRKQSHVARKGSAGYMRLSLTERCNLACSYCFVEELIYKNQFKPSMKDGRFREIINWFVKQNLGRSPVVQYFGGEPLLRMDLIRLGDQLLAEARANGAISGYQQTITTNGTLLTDEMAQWFVARGIDITFSIDGWKELNDAHRVYHNGRGSFDALVTAIEIFRRAGGRISALLTLRPETVKLMPEIVRFIVDEIGARDVAVNSPQPTSEGWEVDGLELAHGVQQSWLFCNERRVAFHALGTHIVSLINNRKPQSDRCFDLNVFGDAAAWPVYVSADGLISFCTVWHRDERLTAPLEMFNAEGGHFRRWHFTDADHAECDGCIAGQICGGPCSLELMLRKGELNPDRCKFFKDMVPWVITR